MTAHKIINEEFLQEDYEFEGHPADLEQIIEVAFEKYADMPKGEPTRKKFRQRINECIDQLRDMRNFQQFTYCH